MKQFNRTLIRVNVTPPSPPSPNWANEANRKAYALPGVDIRGEQIIGSPNCPTSLSLQVATEEAARILAGSFEGAQIVPVNAPASSDIFWGRITYGYRCFLKGVIGVVICDGFVG